MGLSWLKKVRERDASTPVILTTSYNDEMSLNGPQGGVFRSFG